MPGVCRVARPNEPWRVQDFSAGRLLIDTGQVMDLRSLGLRVGGVSIFSLRAVPIGIVLN